MRAGAQPHRRARVAAAVAALVVASLSLAFSTPQTHAATPSPTTPATSTARPGSGSASPTASASVTGDPVRPSATPPPEQNLPEPGPVASTADITPPPSRPVLAVTLDALHPAAPQPGDTIVVAGTLHNISRATVSDISVQLRLGQAVVTRSQFDAYANAPTDPLPTTLVPVTAPTAVRPARLVAGGSERFRVSVATATLALPAVWQVRELGIAAAGTTATGAATLGQLRTFLPWAPKAATGAGLPTAVAWVWPLVDRPHRGIGSRWEDDALAPELAAGGRLSGLLGAAQTAQAPPTPRARRHGAHAVPVTWAIDPMLVEDAQLMSAGYTVGQGKTRRVGTGRTAATGWLAALRGAVTHASVLPLPYGDPDVAAAARAGLATEVGAAANNGRELLSRSLPGIRLMNAGWPPGGVLDQRGVDALFAAGITTLVLSDQALPVIGGQPSETPGAKAVLGTGAGDVNALLTDSELNDTVQDGGRTPGNAAMDLQRYLAETLLIQNEAPSDPRALVMAPDRRWNPPATYAAALLHDTGSVPWIRPVSLRNVTAGPAYTKVTRSPLSYTGSDRRQELPSSYVRGVKSLLGQISDFAAVLSTSESAVREYDAAAQRALSSAWRDAPGRDGQLAGDRSPLSSTMSAVHIISKGGSFVTLTSHHGAVPVTIANDLGTDVRVVLQVEANQRLSLVDGWRKLQVIPAHQTLVVDVHAAAKTSGVFPMQVRLLTPTTGHQYGGVVQLNVRSTVYGTVTLVITGAATAALLIAAGFRLIRRGLRARRGARPGAAEPAR